MTIPAQFSKPDREQIRDNSVNFEQYVVRSASEVFASALGRNTADTLFRTLEILQPEIRIADPKSVMALTLALDESFGKFSCVIKNIIVDKLCLDLGLSLEDSDLNKDFMMVVARIRELIQQRS